MSSSEACYSLDGLSLLLTKKEGNLIIHVKNSTGILLFNKHMSHEEAQKVGLGLFSDIEEFYEGLLEGLERINQSMAPIINQEEKKLTFYNQVMKGGKEKWLEIGLPLQEREYCSLALSNQSCEAETRPTSEKDAQKLEGKGNKENLKTDKELAVEKGVKSNEAKPKSKLWWWQSAPHYSGLFE